MGPKSYTDWFRGKLDIVLSFVGKKWKKEMAVGLEGSWRVAYLGCGNLENKVPTERESDGMWVCDKKR